MKKTAWIIYGALLGIFALLGIVTALSTGSAIFTAFISAVFTSIYLSGLYGYTYQKTIWTRSGWRFLFWLNIASLSLRSIILLAAPTAGVVIDLVVTVIFSIPMLYAIYQYSAPENTLWEETNRCKKTSLLSSLLGDSEEICTSMINVTPAGDENITASVKIENNEYVVKISKEINGESKSFSNSHPSLESAERFLEQNTPIRVSDFARNA
jgi:hypothetical protein